eukprot:scaffold32828_cov112-Isochrysis_galbana.AAC.2
MHTQGQAQRVVLPDHPLRRRRQSQRRHTPHTVASAAARRRGVARGSLVRHRPRRPLHQAKHQLLPRCGRGHLQGYDTPKREGGVCGDERQVSATAQFEPDGARKAPLPCRGGVQREASVGNVVPSHSHRGGVERGPFGDRFVGATSKMDRCEHIAHVARARPRALSSRLCISNRRRAAGGPERSEDKPAHRLAERLGKLVQVGAVDRHKVIHPVSLDGNLRLSAATERAFPRLARGAKAGERARVVRQVDSRASLEVAQCVRHQLLIDVTAADLLRDAGRQAQPPELPAHTRGTGAIRALRRVTAVDIAVDNTNRGGGATDVHDEHAARAPGLLMLGEVKECHSERGRQRALDAHAARARGLDERIGPRRREGRRYGEHNLLHWRADVRVGGGAQLGHQQGEEPQGTHHLPGGRFDRDRPVLFSGACGEAPPGEGRLDDWVVKGPPEHQQQINHCVTRVPSHLP